MSKPAAVPKPDSSLEEAQWNKHDLVARKLGFTLSSQMAVYTLERMFDLGAAAVIFSTALAFALAPHRG